MNRSIQLLTHPDARLPFAAIAVLGLLVGFVVGAFSVRDPNSRFLLREIRDSVNTHSCSGWAQDSERAEMRDETYRTVVQALIDWEKSGGQAVLQGRAETRN